MAPLMLGTLSVSFTMSSGIPHITVFSNLERASLGMASLQDLIN